MNKEDVVHICSRIICSQKNEILPSIATWMDLEGIVHDEISQRKTKSESHHFYVKSKIYITIL